MHDPGYQRAVQRITAAVDEKANITGAVRLCWEDLEPLIVSRYVTVAKLSRDTGANFTALYRAVRRVRWERGQQSSEQTLHQPPRPSGGTPGLNRSNQTAANTQGQASDGREHAPHHATEPASSTSEGKPKRVGNLIIKDQPKHQPAEVPDEDGFITLDNGVRYRRHPRNRKFFEVHRPGDSKPFTTHRKPLPTDRVDP